MGRHVKGLVSGGKLCRSPGSATSIRARSTRWPGIDGFQSSSPKRTSEFEVVIRDKDVDACIIATPHHWHAPIALRAMQAGKDVYIEKPISHVYNEGPLIIAAAKKYGRVVQQGSQMRSSPVTEKAGRLLKEGVIGEVKVARAWTAEPRRCEKPLPDGTPPAESTTTAGSARRRSGRSTLIAFTSTWRMFRDYGNGEIGDDGIHDLDMAAWGLGIDTLPKQITARGGRMLLDGHVSEYPDNMNVTYEYPDGRLLIYENYPFTAYGLHGFDDGNVFYGTEGYMIFSRAGRSACSLGPRRSRGRPKGRSCAARPAIPNTWPISSTPCGIARRPCASPKSPTGAVPWCTWARSPTSPAAGSISIPKTERFVDCDEANRHAHERSTARRTGFLKSEHLGCDESCRSEISMNETVGLAHPLVSRRTAVQAGAVGLLGLGMNHLEALRAATPDEPPSSGRHGEVVHLHLPLRRSGPARELRPQARRPRGNPRRVPPDRDAARPGSRSANTCPAWPSAASTGPWSAR